MENDKTKVVFYEYAAYFVGGPADGAIGMVRPDWEFCFIKQPDEKDSRFREQKTGRRGFLKCSDVPDGDKYKILKESASPKYCKISAAQRVAIWESK